MILGFYCEISNDITCKIIATENIIHNFIKACQNIVLAEQFAQLDEILGNRQDDKIHQKGVNQ